MSCDCDKPGRNGPFRDFLPGVLGCDGLATHQTVVPDGSTTERVQIAGQMPGLRSRTIINAGAVQVTLGNAYVTPTTGVPLPVGGAFTTEYAGEIHACTAPAAGAGLVAVWQESNKPTGQACS